MRGQCDGNCAGILIVIIGLDWTNYLRNKNKNPVSPIKYGSGKDADQSMY